MKKIGLWLFLLLTAVTAQGQGGCPGLECARYYYGTYTYRASCVTASSAESWVNCSVYSDGYGNENCQLSRQCAAPIDPGSPIMIRLGGHGPWTISDAAHGAWFDLDGDGDKELIPWPEGDVTLLANDKNGDGQINDVSELYGSYVPPESPAGTVVNGFDGLQWDDLNHDGWITPDDEVWSALFLWHDINRDALLQPEERISLDSVGIQMLSTQPVATRRQDPQGNLFKYMGKMVRNGHAETFYDAYLPE